VKQSVKKYLSITFIFFLLLNFNLFSQQVKFKTISILQGLSQSTVNCILQDKEGFMWIGTQDGLNKYDGYTFKYFKHDPKDEFSIPDNYIQALCEDKSGNIWVGTYGGGLSCFNKISQKFISFRNDTSNNNSLSNNAITSLACDNKNNLWIGTQDGLNYYDVKSQKFTRLKFSTGDIRSLSSNKISYVFIDDRERVWVATADQGFNLKDLQQNTFTRFVNDPQKENSLIKNSVKLMMQDHNGMIWIATTGGVDMFNPLNFQFTHLRNESKNSINNNDVWVIFEDTNYNMWFGSYGGGLCKYDRKKNVFKVYKNSPTLPESLSNNIVMCAFQDYRGLFWVGTLGGGINIFDPVKESFDHYKQEQGNSRSLSENMVMSFCEYDHDKLWIGTYGGGLNLFNRQTGESDSYKKNEKNKNSLNADILRCVFMDSRRRLWIGTYGGGLNLMDPSSGKFTSFRHDEKDPKSISSDDVWCIAEDKDGTLWIGTWGGGLDHFDPETKTFQTYISGKQGSISNNKVISLRLDKKGNLWIGTNGGGLNLYNRQSDNFNIFKNDPQDPSSISSDRVRCIYDNDKGNLWIGTDGGGLNKMDISSGKFTSLGEKDGLPNNCVYGILEDDIGNLWLSTNNGICKYNPEKNVFQNFDAHDGLQSNEFNQGAYLKASNGQMFFGGVNGFNSFMPQTIRKNPNRPPVFITSIKLFNNEIESDTVFTFKKVLNLNYKDNFLSFEFAAMDYTSSEKNQYSCKMEGFDKDWIKLGNRRFVSYTNLDPGKYIFRIKASNNDGVWNDVGNYLVINISPPFWKTKWFYALSILLICMLIYIYIKWRTIKFQRDKAILEREVKTRTQEVVQQKDVIERKNKDITDSINYAKRIQQAILPPKETMQKLFPQSFVLYKPKDIVSGDFYWVEQYGQYHFIAAVDCTGHGVPGAFMSIVGHNLLNQAVNEHGIGRPAVILNEMNKNLFKQFSQQSEALTVRDGMDIAICAVDPKNKKLQYAGANNPLWIIRNNELIQVKADKQPIGTYIGDGLKPFVNHEIELQKGDLIYIFSDGYADQFGGPQGKKFKYKSFQKLLLDNCNLSMDQQCSILDNSIEEWRGDLEQVDDILVIGIRI